MADNLDIYQQTMQHVEMDPLASIAMDPTTDFMSTDFMSEQWMEAITGMHPHLAPALPPSPQAVDDRAPVPMIPDLRFSRTRASIEAKAAERKGPVSKPIALPQRSKPGRRRIDDEPTNAADRRRKQNREAQRSFRDKRQQKLLDTLEELRQSERQHDADTRFMERMHTQKLAEAKEQIAVYEKYIQHLFVRIEKLRAEIGDEEKLKEIDPEGSFMGLEGSEAGGLMGLEGAETAGWMDLEGSEMAVELQMS